ncbi:porin [Beijerinckia mobilis]|uniref:porin n=1 Tax=Beijerinckia mobilis TaxID=231434 RepID=UPI000A6ACBB0|nr:porin [Beijerinckia mobilis]
MTAAEISAGFEAERRIPEGRGTRLAAMALSVGLSCTGAYADTTDQLLDQLKAKGILSHSEYKTLKGRHAAELKQKERKYVVPGRKVVTKENVVVAPDDRYVTRLDKGIGVHIGAVDVKLTGLLSFFAVETFKTQGNADVAGGLSGNSSVNNTNSIRAGLVPSALVTSISTRQDGYDLGFTLGIYTAGSNVAVGKYNANNGGTATALGTPGIDVRQVFGTIGSQDFGTVKVGRDIALFAADAVLNDATIPGGGTPSGNAAPGNSTLGHIGFGYYYMDWFPQITYISPDIDGFTFSVGVFSPYGLVNYSGLSGTMTGHDQPNIQWKVKYKGAVSDNAELTAWTSGMTQQHRVEIGDSVALNGSMAPGTNIRSLAVDAGARLDVDAVSLLAYAYYGRGMGSTFLFFDGISTNGEKRNSFGGYGQATYTFFDRFTIGAAYGISVLQANYGDPTTLLHSNENIVALARYKLTDWVGLQGEYVHSISRNQAGGSISGDAFVLGTFWSF